MLQEPRKNFQFRSIPLTTPSPPTTRETEERLYVINRHFADLAELRDFTRLIIVMVKIPIKSNETIKDLTNLQKKNFFQYFKWVVSLTLSRIDVTLCHDYQNWANILLGAFLDTCYKSVKLCFLSLYFRILKALHQLWKNLPLIRKKVLLPQMQVCTEEASGFWEIIEGFGEFQIRNTKDEFNFSRF